MIRKILKQTPLIVSFFCFSSCGKKDNDKGTFDSRKAGALVLFDTVSKTSPKIEPGTGLSAHMGSWTLGNRLFEIYTLIRAFVFERDDGKVEGTNIYMQLNAASSYMINAYHDCKPITEKKIVSPFDFETDEIDQTYDCAIDSVAATSMATYTRSYAVKKVPGFDYAPSAKDYGEEDNAEYTRRLSETVKIFLLAISGKEPSGGLTRAIYQGKHTPETGELILNQVSWMTGSREFSTRVHLEGNTKTHIFKAKVASTNVTIAGHGYAEGEGKYYLFRTVDTDMTKTKRYFCLLTNTKEDQVKAMDEAGSPSVPAECADLEAGLPDSNYEKTALPNKLDYFKGKGDYQTGLDY
ncbi:MAG: hypothetical protein HQK54_12035 [Oligoflexales bacterium]|nr:hypothetical protein [Oligoflexales bacterium]